MSKAFTKEEGGGEDALLPVRPRAPAGQKRPITPEGYRALQQELAALATPTEGEEEGSLEAQARAQERARRAMVLAATLDDVQVVSPGEAEAGRVAFGASVTLDDESGAEVTYRLVGPDEADARAGRLSVESPLARALLGRREGESVVVERPRGAVEYTVRRVSHEPPGE